MKSQAGRGIQAEKKRPVGPKQESGAGPIVATSW